MLPVEGASITPFRHEAVSNCIQPFWTWSQALSNQDFYITSPLFKVICYRNAFGDDIATVFTNTWTPWAGNAKYDADALHRARSNATVWLSHGSQWWEASMSGAT